MQFPNLITSSGSRVYPAALPRRTRKQRTRQAAALMMAIFIMSVTSATVIYILDTETVQYAALRNMLAYDRARYLAEAGLQHALAELEGDITWRGGIPTTEFPAGSGNVYSATLQDGAAGSVVVTSIGITPVDTAKFMQRRLQITVKQGG